MALKRAILPYLDEIKVQDAGAKIVVGEDLGVVLVAKLKAETWEHINKSIHENKR